MPLSQRYFPPILISALLWPLSFAAAQDIQDKVVVDIDWVGAGRVSLFYFDDELEKETAARSTNFHASAIQFAGNGDASVWINGLEMKVRDRLGPIEITKIEPSAAILLIQGADGIDRSVRLAMNQTVSIETLTVREGKVPAGYHQNLSRTRLP